MIDIELQFNWQRVLEVDYEIASCVGGFPQSRVMGYSVLMSPGIGEASLAYTASHQPDGKGEY